MTWVATTILLVRVATVVTVTTVGGNSGYRDSVDVYYNHDTSHVCLLPAIYIRYVNKHLADNGVEQLHLAPA